MIHVVTADTFGAARAAAAELIAPDIRAALDLLLRPLRLVATLRR